MNKSILVLAFLPLVAACAGTAAPGVKTAQECRIVANDDLGSHIKTTKQCSPSTRGSSVETGHQSETVPAPQ